MRAIVVALLFLWLALASGCFARGNVVLSLDAPTPEHWTPAGLLVAAVEAAEGDVNATRVLEYGVVFDEEDHLRILRLRLYTQSLDDRHGFYLDFLVGEGYDATADRIVFRGFRHEELGLGQRPDPAKEWDVTPLLLEILGRVSFAQASAPQAAPLGQVPMVREFVVSADCKPAAQQAETGDWSVYNATAAFVEKAGGDWGLSCFTRPQLPPTLRINLHTPCYAGPLCPEAVVHQSLLQFVA